MGTTRCPTHGYFNSGSNHMDPCPACDVEQDDGKGWGGMTKAELRAECDAWEIEWANGDVKAVLIESLEAASAE